MMDHAFKPSEADPNRCGHQLPSCAPWPAPPTQSCWGLESQHPTVEEIERPRRRYDRCDDTCTVDCGHCKGAGRPKATS